MPSRNFSAERQQQAHCKAQRLEPEPRRSMLFRKHPLSEQGSTEHETWRSPERGGDRGDQYGPLARHPGWASPALGQVPNYGISAQKVCEIFTLRFPLDHD